jgi:hypothetical protein
MTTRGMSVDHRRIALADRAQRRTQRRCLLLLAACDADQVAPSPELVTRLDRLIGEADALWERLTGMPEAEALLRQAWRTAA